MSERIMKNFPFEYEGNTYWRSRSVAVVGFVFCKDKEGHWCVLVNQRGSGCPDENFKWNAPCGFLDFNENGQEAVAREIYEETGVSIAPDCMQFMSVNFSKNNDQNVTLRYTHVIEGKCITDVGELSSAHSETNEIACIKWIKLRDLKRYKWAFGHENLIQEMAVQALQKQITQSLICSSLMG